MDIKEIEEIIREEYSKGTPQSRAAKRLFEYGILEEELILINLDIDDVIRCAVMNELRDLWRKECMMEQEVEKFLTDHNIYFMSRDNGNHLIVEGPISIVRHIDFWPKTGKWISRDLNGKKGVGVHSLVKYIKRIGYIK